jgi:putative membrane protein
MSDAGSKFSPSKKFPIILLGIYIIFFTVMGIHPYDRNVWFAEVAPLVIIVLFLVATFKKFQFSNTSYVMMAVLLFLHTIGAHYTFERVPFDMITDYFGFERNHFDRIAHFSVGFYAFPIAEYLLRNNEVKSTWLLYTVPILAIFTVANVYEIIEWLYAATADAKSGIAFLGSQGDIWDAQKDMLADGLGSFAAMIVFWIKKHTCKIF